MATGEGPIRRDRIRTLVVEDDPDSRRILAMRLRRIGAFLIREVADGEEAVALAETWEPELILLDLKLPGLNGWEVARRIRAKEAVGTHVPIIAVSAQALPGDEEAAVRAGCDCYLSKPIVDQGDLRNQIARFFPILRAGTEGADASPA